MNRIVRSPPRLSDLWGERWAMRYCPACGTEFADPESWPRRCQDCGHQQFRNPIPVSVVLLPVDSGVLVVRRAIPPGKGQLALPGGFVNWGESWQQAGARELLEETGIAVDPTELCLLDAQSVDEGVMLLFSVAQPRRRETLVWRADPAEISEILVLTEPQELAFSTHTAQLSLFFERRCPG